MTRKTLDESDFAERGRAAQEAIDRLTPREAARRRAAAGEQFLTPDDVYFALQELQTKHTSYGSPLWYLFNRLLRLVSEEK